MYVSQLPRWQSHPPGSIPVFSMISFCVQVSKIFFSLSFLLSGWLAQGSLSQLPDYQLPTITYRQCVPIFGSRSRPIETSSLYASAVWRGKDTDRPQPKYIPVDFCSGALLPPALSAKAMLIGGELPDRQLEDKQRNGRTRA